MDDAPTPPEIPEEPVAKPKLSLTQRISIVALLLPLLALPVALMVALNPVHLFQRAATYTATPPTNPTLVPSPIVLPTQTASKRISWKTTTVLLEADDLYIKIIKSGKKFTPRNAKVSLHSDPGNPQYTTLEATWQEQGKEMRLFIYFKSDGQNWWANEVRTYDGQKPGNWIYYTGEFFKSRVGSTYTGSFDITSNSTQNTINGLISFKNLRLITTLR